MRASLHNGLEAVLFEISASVPLHAGLFHQVTQEVVVKRLAGRGSMEPFNVQMPKMESSPLGCLATSKPSHSTFCSGQIPTCPLKLPLGVIRSKHFA